MLIKIADTSNLTVQQYTFTRIEEILGRGSDYTDTDKMSLVKKNAKLFTSDGTRIVDAPFLRALNSSDNYLQRVASEGLGYLLTVCEGNASALIQWINTKLVSTSAGVWEMALPALVALVHSENNRTIFVQNNGVANIVSLLRRIGANGNSQQLYDLTFILWTLTLSVDPDVKVFLQGGAISLLVGFLASASTRKIARMIVAALKNLASSEDSTVLSEMFSNGLEKVLDNQMHSAMCKQSNDSEFDSDIRNLHNLLFKNYRDLSTFDKWASEVNSGDLRWGVVHSDKFWKDNYKYVEAGDFKCLKDLIEILKSSFNNVSVYCYFLHVVVV
jgi:V-type H+-transporting ATPase subunit H